MNTSQEIKIDSLFKEYTSCLSDNQRLLNKIILDEKLYNERFYLALTDNLSKAKSLLKGMYTSSVYEDIDLHLKLATDSLISCIDGIKSSNIFKSSNIYLIHEVKLSIAEIETTFFKRDLNLIEWGSLLFNRLYTEKKEEIDAQERLENDLDKFRQSHEKRKTLTKAKEILDLRQEKGIKTYGTTLDDANLSDKELLNHAIEEVADLFLYLTKLKNNG